MVWRPHFRHTHSPPQLLSHAVIAPTSEQIEQFVSLRAPESWVSPAVHQSNYTDGDDHRTGCRSDRNDDDEDLEDSLYDAETDSWVGGMSEDGR